MKQSKPFHLYFASKPNLKPFNLNVNSRPPQSNQTLSCNAYLFLRAPFHLINKKPKAQKACVWAFGEKSDCRLQKATEKSCNNVIKEKKE
jgi:hypothetical protein